MNTSETTNTEIWNELQNIKIKLVNIEKALEQWSDNLENIRQGFLAAVEEFEKEYQDGKN